jgi:hypothetical protein
VNPVITTKTTNSSPIFFIMFINISPLIFVYLAQDKNFLRPAYLTR